MGVYYMMVEEVSKRKTLPIFSNMLEAEYAYDMGRIKLREPIQVLLTSKFDSMSVLELGVSDRVLTALQKNNVQTIGQLMDHYAHGEAKMVKVCLISVRQPCWKSVKPCAVWGFWVQCGLPTV